MRMQPRAQLYTGNGNLSRRSLILPLGDATREARGVVLGIGGPEVGREALSQRWRGARVYAQQLQSGAGAVKVGEQLRSG